MRLMFGHKLRTHLLTTGTFGFFPGSPRAGIHLFSFGSCKIFDCVSCGTGFSLWGSVGERQSPLSNGNPQAEACATFAGKPIRPADKAVRTRYSRLLTPCRLTGRMGERLRLRPRRPNLAFAGHAACD